MLNRVIMKEMAKSFHRSSAKCRSYTVQHNSCKQWCYTIVTYVFLSWHVFYMRGAKHHLTWPYFGPLIRNGKSRPHTLSNQQQKLTTCFPLTFGDSFSCPTIFPRWIFRWNLAPGLRTWKKYTRCWAPTSPWIANTWPPWQHQVWRDTKNHACTMGYGPWIQFL